jgi:hypothetical protein
MGFPPCFFEKAAKKTKLTDPVSYKTTWISVFLRMKFDVNFFAGHWLSKISFPNQLASVKIFKKILKFP